MRAVRLWVATVLLAGVVLAPVDAASLVIKLGTVVPDGSVWYKVLRRLGDEWRRETAGRVTLQVYPGGTQGTESAMIKRMRFDQLQAASLSAVGLSEIDEAFNVFSIPMFYESYDEVDHVLGRLAPELDARLERKGFKRLNWGHGGWVQVFSKRPVRTVPDIKALKLFTSAGNDRMVQWYKDNGFRPVPLAVSDMMTALQTGMVEAIPVTPLAALSFQWYQQTPYMLDLGLAPLVGATVMTLDAWERIGPEDRPKVLEAAARAERELRNEVPKQDQAAIEEMKARKLTVTKAEGPEWRRAAEDFARSMRGTMVPADLFDLAARERDEYRKARGGSR
jgi:TRAP-type C4-dicarboxylate transport system substrate-binding protein